MFFTEIVHPAVIDNISTTDRVKIRVSDGFTKDALRYSFCFSFLDKKEAKAFFEAGLKMVDSHDGKIE